MIETKPQAFITNDALKLATEFYQVGERAYSSITKTTYQDNPDLIFRLQVAIVNMSLSCEILVKNILCHTGKKIKEIPAAHDLKTLFGILNPVLKERIRSNVILKYKGDANNMNYNCQSFSYDLEQYKNSFIDSRYYYELGQKGKNSGPLFVKYLNESLLSCARIIIESSPSMGDALTNTWVGVHENG